MGEEIKKYIVGPMPAQQFLDDFLPVEHIPGLDSVSSFSPHCYDKTIAAETEPKSYKPFVSRFYLCLYYFSCILLVKVATTRKFTSGLKVVNSSSHCDRNVRTDFSFKIKPDISIYRTDTTKSDPGIKTDSSVVEIFIEVKWHPNDDPFGDVHDAQCPDCGGTVQTFLRDTKSAKDTLGQITSYAAVQFGAQFRTHVYSVLIVKDTARILRWDRSGTIVTEAIHYNESPLLVEFFRRYSKASPEMRGRDQSVSEPTRQEAIAARQSLNLDDTILLVKLEIPGADGSPHFFIAAAPRATPYPPPGRATRGFQAYDIARQTRVFLKDSWRVDLPDIQAEGLTYETLMKANVRNIPRCHIAGDISTADYHATKTHHYATKPWACHSHAMFIPHRHYRLVLDIIGRSLTTFKSSYEMVAAIRDALYGEYSQQNCPSTTLISMTLALKDAFIAGILHHDFSPGNVIIIKDCCGMLINWDLSKPLSLKPETPRRATRTVRIILLRDAIAGADILPPCV